MADHPVERFNAVSWPGESPSPASTEIARETLLKPFRLHGPLARRHLDDIKVKIEDLRRMRRVLSSTAQQCSRDASRECPIIDALAGT
jgi:hypothetical protein